MKIGFPVLEKASTDALELDASLHGSKYFGVFDTSDSSVKIINTEADQNDAMGMELIHFLKGENIDHIISSECHPMAARFFINNNIDLFKAHGTHILTNIQLLKQNNLKPFSSDSGMQTACYTSCSSCSSDCSKNNPVGVSS